MANEALVAMLDREKGNCRAALGRHQELEMHMQEVGAPPAASSAPMYKGGISLYSGLLLAWAETALRLPAKALSPTLGEWLLYGSSLFTWC